MENNVSDRRWRKLEAARSQTRKVAYTLMAVVLTSLLLAVTASPA